VPSPAAAHTHLVGYDTPMGAAMLPVAQHVAKELLADNERRGVHTVPKVARQHRAQRRVMREFRPRLTSEIDPRYEPATVRRRQRSVTAVREANKRWEQEARSSVTREDYLRSVLPSLRKLKLSDVVRATGLSKASCSRIRRGLSIPHSSIGSLAVLGRHDRRFR